MLATDTPSLAASKDKSTATSIHKRQIDSKTASKPANPTQIRPHPYLPLPENRRSSSERSSSAAGLNTARTSTPSLVVSCGREEETTPTARAGVANANEGAAASSSVLVLPYPFPQPKSPSLCPQHSTDPQNLHHHHETESSTHLRQESAMGKHEFAGAIATAPMKSPWARHVGQSFAGKKTTGIGEMKR